ncbi:MAG: SDR family NAD(P)-dependent oxidoreductase [bacterium]|nr:SDR family NAD(P)-dependent oxidoreductase [bacterium]
MSTVVVTGASGALGNVVVTHLLSTGWSVIATILPTEDGKGLEAQGAEVRTVDLTDAEGTKATMHDLPPDTTGLVHLAGGIVAGKPTQETSATEVENMFMINTFTFFNIVRAVLPALQSSGGSVVSIGTQSVLHPVSNRSAYVSSKAAVASLTLSIAEEGRSTGVRANCILPSIILTQANLEWAEGDEADNWVRPEEIASTIAHLLDPACNVSGALIPIYGKVPF